MPGHDGTGLWRRATSAGAGRYPIAAVLLDRDGTVNVKAPEGQYITSPGELVLLPGAAGAIAQLNAASVQVILVTNQRWLSTMTDRTPYERVHARLERTPGRERRAP